MITLAPEIFTASSFFTFWFSRTRDLPSIWQTVPDDDLRCGSEPLCFDEVPKIRCSVDMESQLCGEFDFITTPAKNVAGAISRTSNVHTWFHNCIQTAYVSNVGLAEEIPISGQARSILPIRGIAQNESLPQTIGRSTTRRFLQILGEESAIALL